MWRYYYNGKEPFKEEDCDLQPDHLRPLRTLDLGIFRYAFLEGGTFPYRKRRHV